MEEHTATKKTEAHTAKPSEEKKAVAAAPAQKDANAIIAEATQARKAAKKDAPAKPADSKAKADKKPVEKEEKKREIVLERVCVVNLTGVYNKTKDKRLARGVKLVRQYAARHAKAPIAKVKLATNVNEQIRSHGSSWVQKKIKIRLTKDKNGGVLAEVAK